jgi:predicted transcriptional regulator
VADIFRPARSGPAAVLGPLEGVIMEVIWRAGCAVPVPDVHQALVGQGRKISYSAVKAVLNNLATKGRLEKSRAGKVTLFAAAASRDAFEAQVIATVVASLKRNFGRAAIAQLVDELVVDQETLEDLERMVAQRRSELES